MKKLFSTALIALLSLAFIPLQAARNPNEKLGLPGDNLNLYAVMDIFQNSETLEEFERKLNDPQLLINNLDLNNDNQVDYIFVNDYPTVNIHQIVLQVALGKDDLQDVAVFIVEKLRNGGVSIQLIGDEDLYGPNYIVEPVYDSTPNPGYIGNVRKQVPVETVTVVHTTYYEVAGWPMIVFITRPAYVPWRSAWRWGYYPPYWATWRPYYWDYYYGYHYPSFHYYHTCFRLWHQPRSVYYRDVYYGHHRHRSPIVVVNINNGRYRDTYSRPEQRRDGEAYYNRRVAENQYVPGRGQRTNVQGQAVRQNGQNLVNPGLQRGQQSPGRAETKQMERPVNGNTVQNRATPVQRSLEAGKDRQIRTQSVTKETNREPTRKSDVYGRQSQQESVGQRDIRKDQTPVRQDGSSRQQKVTTQSGSDNPVMRGNTKSNERSGGSKAGSTVSSPQKSSSGTAGLKQDVIRNSGNNTPPPAQSKSSRKSEIAPSRSESSSKNDSQRLPTKR